MINVDEDIIVYAFRYTLGRSTYAVRDMVEVLISNWGILSLRTRNLIRKEIETAIYETGKYGWEMDKNEWLKILELPNGKE